MKKRLYSILLLFFLLFSVNGTQKAYASCYESEYACTSYTCQSIPENKNKATIVNELIIKNGERNIYGVVSEPIQKGLKKVAIISHGFNGTYHFAKDYYETLNSLGYIVYSFDFPCGSVNSRSDSNTMNMSVLDEKKDLESIINYFMKQPGIDKNNIVLIGESQGGLVSALAASDYKKRISKLILIYPALCIPDNWNERYPKTNDIPDTTSVWNIPIGKKFFMELRNMNVYDIIKSYKGPVLIIHGSNDPVVPPSYSEKAVNVYKRANLKIIHGAGHGFKPDERSVSNKYVYDFLK